MKLNENMVKTYSISITEKELIELHKELTMLDLIKDSMLELLYSIIYVD